MLGPLALAKCLVCRPNPPGQGKHQGKTEFGNRAGTRPLDSPQGDIVLPYVVEVEVVDAGTGSYQ